MTLPLVGVVYVLFICRYVGVFICPPLSIVHILMIVEYAVAVNEANNTCLSVILDIVSDSRMFGA